jgi:hypothetical protein
VDLKEVKWKVVLLPLAGGWWPASWVAYHLHMHLLGKLITIGDGANPIVPAALSVTVGVLNFPMFYLWFPIGEWLKPHLSDNGVMEMFVSVNALFWVSVARWLLAWTFAAAWSSRREGVVA